MCICVLSRFEIKNNNKFYYYCAFDVSSLLSRKNKDMCNLKMGIQNEHINTYVKHELVILYLFVRAYPVGKTWNSI